MNVWYSATRRIAVVAPMGELDIAVAEQVRRALLAALEAEQLVVVDFALVTFVDSTVIGVLIGASRRARDSGKQLLVVHALPAIRRVFELVGATHLMPLRDDRPPERLTSRT